MYRKQELENLCKNKKFLLTGHTGFKGAYMTKLIEMLGGKVYGYALPGFDLSLYKTTNLKEILSGELISDIRDIDKLKNFIKEVNPDYVIHMAAQPIVLTSYELPRDTYEINVMGTVNLLEACRNCGGNIKSILNVTTDKVYENNDKKGYLFVESDKLCGFDPYANSKSCSELVTYSYRNSFFKNMNISISTARAGNVIAAGDVSEYRIIPDCYRAVKDKKNVLIRNPYSIRPYQYVMEPLIMYLNILLKSEDRNFEGHYNVGPDKESCINTEKLVKDFFDSWNSNNKKFDEIDKKFGCFEGFDKKITSSYEVSKDNENLNKNHEAKFLQLDNSLIKKVFSYKPLFNIEEAIYLTAKGYKLLEVGNINKNRDILTKSIELALDKLVK